MCFKPDQTINAVPGGERRRGAGLMLVYAAHKVVGNAKVECPMPPAGKEIYIKQQLPRRVIPGRPAWAGPGTYEYGSRSRKHEKLQNCLNPACMGSGLAAPLRPGMTPSVSCRNYAAYAERMGRMVDDPRREG